MKTFEKKSRKFVPKGALTHVPGCMSESLTLGGGENVPGIPEILRIWQEVHASCEPMHMRLPVHVHPDNANNPLEECILQPHRQQGNRVTVYSVNMMQKLSHTFSMHDSELDGLFE